MVAFVLSKLPGRELHDGRCLAQLEKVTLPLHEHRIARGVAQRTAHGAVELSDKLPANLGIVFPVGKVGHVETARRVRLRHGIKGFR